MVMYSFSSFGYACCSSYKINISYCVNLILFIIIICSRVVTSIVSFFMCPSFEYSFLLFSMLFKCLLLFLFTMTKVNHQFWLPPYLVSLFVPIWYYEFIFCEKNVFILFILCFRLLFLWQRQKKMFISFFLQNKSIFFILCLLLLLIPPFLSLSLSFTFCEKN